MAEVNGRHPVASESVLTLTPGSVLCYKRSLRAAMAVAASAFVHSSLLSSFSRARARSVVPLGDSPGHASSASRITIPLSRLAFRRRVTRTQE